MTHRNGFLLFISSCLSGCGQMYQGYMKRGLSLLLAFCLILFASTYFFLGALALFLPVIWLYAFFDSYALRSQLAAGTAPEDAFLFGLSDMDSKRLGELLRKRHSLIGWALVVVGVYMLYDTVEPAGRSLLRLVRGVAIRTAALWPAPPGHHRASDPAGPVVYPGPQGQDAH